MTYTKKMHDTLRRDTKNKKNHITDLLDEIDRLTAIIKTLSKEIEKLTGIIQSLCNELGRKDCTEEKKVSDDNI